MLEYYRALLGQVAMAGYGETLCLTWSYELSPLEVVERLGGDTRMVRPSSLRTLCDDFNLTTVADYEAMGIVGSLGTWALAIEPLSIAGSDVDVLARLSEGDSRAVNVLFHIGGNDRITYAVNGELLANIPLMFSGDDVGGSHPESLRSLQEEFSFPTGNAATCRTAGLAAAERLTGQRLTQQWLMAAHTGFAIP